MISRKSLAAALLVSPLISAGAFGSEPAVSLITSADIQDPSEPLTAMTWTNVLNISLTDNGHVAAIVEYNDGIDAYSKVLYKNGVLGTAVKVADTRSSTSPYPKLDSISFNLAISRDFTSTERVTFIGTVGADSSIYSYNATAGARQTIMTSGAGVNTPDASGNPTGGAFALDPFLGLQVNSAGQATFSGTAGGSDVALRGGPGNVIRVADQSATLSDFNYAPGADSFVNKKVLTTSPATGSPTAVFLAKNSSIDSIVEADNSSTYRNRFSAATSQVFTLPDGVSSTTSQSVRPYDLLDANHNAELFEGSINGSTTSYGLFVHRKEAGGADSYFQLAAIQGPLATAGQMTESGHAVVGVADTITGTTNSIAYFNGTSTLTIAQLNQIVPGTGGLSISSLLLLGNHNDAPMINENDQVVFSATLSDSSDALLCWTPSTTGLGLLLKSNDPNFMLDGQNVSLDQIGALLNNENLTESGRFKDELSEDGRLSVAVAYNGSNIAVVLVSVPEPSTIMGLAGFFTLFSLRRSRRSLRDKK